MMLFGYGHPVSSLLSKNASLWARVSLVHWDLLLSRTKSILKFGFVVVRERSLEVLYRRFP